MEEQSAGVTEDRHGGTTHTTNDDDPDIAVAHVLPQRRPQTPPFGAINEDTANDGYPAYAFAQALPQRHPQTPPLGANNEDTINEDTATANESDPAYAFAQAAHALNNTNANVTDVAVAYGNELRIDSSNENESAEDTSLSESDDDSSYDAMDISSSSSSSIADELDFNEFDFNEFDFNEYLELLRDQDRPCYDAIMSDSNSSATSGSNDDDEYDEENGGEDEQNYASMPQHDDYESNEGNEEQNEEQNYASIPSQHDPHDPDGLGIRPIDGSMLQVMYVLMTEHLHQRLIEDGRMVDLTDDGPAPPPAGMRIVAWRTRTTVQNTNFRFTVTRSDIPPNAEGKREESDDEAEGKREESDDEAEGKREESDDEELDRISMNRDDWNENRDRDYEYIFEGQEENEGQESSSQDWDPNADGSDEAEMEEQESSGPTAHDVYDQDANNDGNDRGDGDEVIDLTLDDDNEGDEYRLLRDTQDREYEEALLMDQIREIERREEQERLSREEEEEREAEGIALRAQQEMMDKARELMAKASEPADGPGVVSIRFTLPNGKKVDRKFRIEETVGVLRAFMMVHLEEEGIDFKNISLSTNFPTQTFREDEDAIGLEDAGLSPHAVMMVHLDD